MKIRARSIAAVLALLLALALVSCNTTSLLTPDYSQRPHTDTQKPAPDDPNTPSNPPIDPPVNPGVDPPVNPPVDPPIDPDNNKPDNNNPDDDKPDNKPPQTPFITLAHIPLSLQKGDLILVNRDHSYDPAFAASDLMLIKKAITDDVLLKDLVLAQYEMYLTATTANALARLSHDMQTALSSKNNIHIYSAYRSSAHQQSIIDDYLSRPGYGQDYVDKYVAPVGGSEHHTGLAVDINFYNDETGASHRFDAEAVKAEYAWLLANAHTYGLIWRYQADKADITGYNEEIWHFRYVGTPHAEYMKTNGICFEEYHALIEKATFDKPLVFQTSDGQTYSIYADNPEDGLQVPQSLAYSLSGSNRSYFVVTVEGSYEDAGIIYQDSSENVELIHAPDMGEKYTNKLTFLADTQVYLLKDSNLLPPPTNKIGRVWCSASDQKLNFKYINTLAVMVDTEDSDRYWISNTIEKTVEAFSPEILILSIGLDGGVNRQYPLTDSESADIWRKLINSILEACPDTVVILQSVLPLGINAPEAYSYTSNADIRQFNSTMLHVATELHATTHRVFYLDTASVMTDTSGYLKAAYTNDGVSLNETGLSAMMQYIRTHPYVEG